MWIWRNVRFVSHTNEDGMDNMGHQSGTSRRGIPFSRFFDLKSFHRRAGSVTGPFGEFTMHANVSQCCNSLWELSSHQREDDQAPSPRLQ